MTHEEALNLILSQACSTPCEDNPDDSGSPRDYHEYAIELHCIRLVVEARHLGNLKYEIRAVKKD
jgi:hypothetical protein